MDVSNSQTDSESGQNTNLKKIDKEKRKSEQVEKYEDSRPIQLDENLSPDELMSKERSIVDDLTGKFNKWEAWRRSYEKVWDQIYRLYFSAPDKIKTQTRSSIAVPIIFQVIEAAIPKIVNTLFSGEEFFDVVPTNPNEQNLADYIKLLLAYQLSQADFFVKFLDFTKQLLLYGTSYFKVYWKVKRQWVWSRKPKRVMNSIMGFMLGKPVQWEEKKSYEVIERRPELDVVDILDVFPDPEASNEKDMKGIYIRSWIDQDELAELGQGKFPVYTHTDSDDLKGKTYTYQQSRQLRYSVRATSSGAPTESKQVELLEYWGPYDIDGDGIREEAYVVIGNRRVLLAAKPNPFHHQKAPLIRTVLFPVPMEWYGLGMVEPVISNVYELYTLRRQRLDNINIIINRMWKVNSLADIDLDVLISSPNNIIITDDMAGIEALSTPDVTQSAYEEAAIVQSDIENATAPRSVQGSPESGKLGRTAKGASLIIGQALEKFGTAIKLIEEQAIKKILRRFHQLNLQFIDQDDVLRDPGLYGHLFDSTIKVEHIQAEVNFKMLGISEMIGKEAKINQSISFMGVFGKVLAPQTITQIAKKVWGLMGFSPDEIEIQGMQPPPNAGNVLDPGISAAITGQANNQGAGAGAPTVPTSGGNPVA